MVYRAAFSAVALGVAAVFAVTATSIAAPKKRPPPAPVDSYENHGALPGMPPPVPYFALSTYKPGMCWKVNDPIRETGDWIPCSQFFKRNNR
jgi:hypothetical protein